MLRELNENEMEMVSGGAADEVVVTATIVRRKKPAFTNQNAFGGRTSSEQYHEDFQPGGGINFPNIEINTPTPPTTSTTEQEKCTQARHDSSALLLAITGASFGTPDHKTDPLGAMDNQADIAELGAGYLEARERVRQHCG